MKKLLLLFSFIIYSQLLLAQSPFMTYWRIDDSDQTIEMKLNSNHNYDIEIDWEYLPGSPFVVEEVVTGRNKRSISHTYASAGDKLVAIRGVLPSVSMNGLSDVQKEKLLLIMSWGDSEWTSFNFWGCTNLKINASNAPIFSTSTDVSVNLTNAFRGCTSLTTEDFNDWNMENVKNMDGMFRDATNFNGEIGEWDTSSVEYMAFLFDNASSFNKPLNWDTSNVKTMTAMFKDAIDFNQPINHDEVNNYWDVSSVTNMFAMFDNATSFNQDLDNWNIASLTNITYMFRNAIAFNGALNGWTLPEGLTSLLGMFLNAQRFNQPLNDWKVNNITSFQSMFNGASTFNQDINAWRFDSADIMTSMFSGAESFNQPLNEWNVENVTIMIGMFSGATSFNQDISGWTTTNLTNVQSMFIEASSFNQDIGGWDISNLTNASGLFFSATSFSNENYDKLLAGWGDRDPVQSNVALYAVSQQYCAAGEAGRDYLISKGWNISDAGLNTNCTEAIRLPIKLFLEGAYDKDLTNLMKDNLRGSGLLPLATPYIDGVSTTQEVLDVTGNDAIVDWIWVELRDKTDNTLVIEGYSAIIQKDGDVVDLDGVSPLLFSVSADNYYIAVAHYNHLGIITTNPVAISASTPLIDFTIGTEIINGGDNAVTNLGDGYYGLTSGDFDGNGQIQNSDIDGVLPLLGTSSYSPADVDMNGQIQNTDVSTLQLNLGSGEQMSRQGTTNSNKIIIITAPRKQN